MHEEIGNLIFADCTFRNECQKTQQEIAQKTRYNIDPHTSVAVNVAKKVAFSSQTVVMSTAHPRKFAYEMQNSKGRPHPHANLESLNKTEQNLDSFELEAVSSRISSYLKK